MREHKKHIALNWKEQYILKEPESYTSSSDLYHCLVPDTLFISIVPQDMNWFPYWWYYIMLVGTAAKYNGTLGNVMSYMSSEGRR